ncbi:MAG TPA: glycosyltransferase family A protein [Pyrinomonadaceae bacterium]
MNRIETASKVQDVGRAPKISVVIPAYNVAQYIGETLQSVFAQTFKDFEVIVVNDGSPDTDALELALEPYAGRVIYLKQENRGAAAARNQGLRAAHAPLVAFLDADDLWLPGYLQEQIAFMEGDGSDLVYSDALLFGDSVFAGRTYMETAPSDGEVTFQSLVSGQCNVITSGVVARRQLVLDVGAFDEALRNAHDFDLWVRLVRSGARLNYQRRVLLRYRFHEDSLSGDVLNRINRELRVLDKIESAYALSTEERAATRSAREKLEASLKLETGKQHLARGEFREAREAFKKANGFYRSWKLRAVMLLLRLCPRLLRRIYLRRLGKGG